MIHRLLPVLTLLALLATGGQARAQYRGMAAGWPNYASGNYAAYYAPGYGGPLYYVARPTYAPATYVPVTAAYANSAYFGGYNVAPVQYQQPAAAAYYAPPAGAYYAPAAAQYAPTTAQYAPTNSYTVSPAGTSPVGTEAYAGYGQPTRVNYVPPRFVYRTTYAAVPVYMYRPVTTYDPVTAQPVTCLQPATTTQCQPQRSSWFSHSWFNWGHWWGSGCCGSAPATANYCTSGYCPTTCGTAPCGQPYYPTQPGVIIPTVPAPAAVGPSTIITNPGVIPRAGATVPPPPTRSTIVPGTSIPADTRPSLGVPPGGFTPRSGPGTIIPGTTIPGTTVPGTSIPGSGSFPVDPSGAAPGGSFGPSPATPFGTPSGSGFGGSGTFPSGSNYAPVTDPYSNSSAAISPIRPPQERATQAAGATSEPPSTPILAPGVQSVPDPDAQKGSRPINRAPQLLDPRDKSAAARDARWAVVPAVWPQQPTAAASPYRVYEQRSYNQPREESRNAPAATSDSAGYDDTGWKSARM